MNDVNQSPKAEELDPKRIKYHPNQEIGILEDAMFFPPFGTVRACLDCGVLVAGGPTRCKACANTDEPV